MHSFLTLSLNSNLYLLLLNLLITTLPLRSIDIPSMAFPYYRLRSSSCHRQGCIVRTRSYISN